MYVYSVMQSDQNSFYDDEVFESISISYGGEGNILDQIYDKQKYSNFYHDDFFK